MNRIDRNEYVKGIQRIVSEVGMQPFNDCRVFISLLNDILPHPIKGGEIFRSTLKPTILKQVCTVNNCIFLNRKNEIGKLESLIEKETALPKDLVVEVVSIYATVFSWKYAPETIVGTVKPKITTTQKVNVKTGSHKKINNSQTKPFIVTGMELFEYDGSSYYATKTSGQVFLKNEVRYIGAMLSFDKPQKDTNIEVKWQIFNEDGMSLTKEMTVNDIITPENMNYNVSWGWPEKGRWSVGKYKVVAKINDSREWTSTFEITNGVYNHPDTHIHELKLFSGGEDAPDINSRKYDKSFQKARLQRLYFELHFEPIAQNYYTTINYKVNYPNGEQCANYAAPIQLQPGYEICWVGLGWQEAGYWTEGLYKYEISLGNGNKVHGTFVVK